MKVVVIKTQINPTTYCIYSNRKKKKPTPSIIVIMIATKKMSPHRPPTVHIFMTTQKNKELLNSFYCQCN